MDYGTRYTDRAEKELAARLKRVYAEAQKDIRAKIDEFTKTKKRRSAQLLAKVSTGQMTMEQYREWEKGQVFVGKQWQKRLNEMTERLTDSNKEAMRMIHDQQDDVFAENGNFELYQTEMHTGVSFDIYNKDAVNRLIREKPELLPRKQVNPGKDRAWNQGVIANALTQAILQGESMDKVASRLARDTASTDYKAMMRYARTAMTGAQNAGRLDGLRKTVAMGILVLKTWDATHDGKTRDAHRELDGEEKPIEEPFTNSLGKIMYPGDPTAHPGNVCNCRCALTRRYPEYQDEREDPDNVGGIPYEEWKKGKQQESTTNKPIYTQKEKDALHEYTTSTYSGINTLLREGGLSNYPQLQETVEEIDRAMAKSTIPQGTIVSRGATDADLRGLFKEHKRNWFEKYDNLKSLEGETASFDSYLSTTRGAAVAEPYKKQVEWVLEVGEGVHGIDMMPFANQGKAEVEREILFARGQNITINKVDCNADDDGDIYGVITIHATIKRKKVKT